MGQSVSKDEMLYRQVCNNNVNEIKSLCREGARLEWIDNEGKTPLIVACMNPELYNVAKTLLEHGAKVDAYRSGTQAGTPLHHAASGGIENTVTLLLSHGANVYLMNDDRQTALSIARAKGFSNVVRAIEAHVCLFSGWLRGCHYRGFLEKLFTGLFLRRMWVVVLPCELSNLGQPLKVELALYSKVQDAMPRICVELLNTTMEATDFNVGQPVVTIIDNNTETTVKLESAHGEDERQDLVRFFNVCKGFPQVPVTADPAASFSSNGIIKWDSNVPSAPILTDEIIYDGPIHYPSIDSTPVDMSATGSSSETKDSGESSSCVICLDAPAEGACAPCGHVAGCMPCLNEIKGKKWGCPVCRAEIDQVIRLYHV